MTYLTEYDGQITIEPPLNITEIVYLRAFVRTWHPHRPNDPYYIVSDISLECSPARLIPFDPQPSQRHPGASCHWRPTQDGTALVWDDSEPFAAEAKWMQYLIGHFVTSTAGTFWTEPRAVVFTLDRRCFGHLRTQGEAMKDRWALAVSDNRVEVHDLY